jgi:hypothetical protein
MSPIHYVAYADLPWSFATYSHKGKGRSAEAYYNCMSLADDFALRPVRRDPALRGRQDAKIRRDHRAPCHGLAPHRVTPSWRPVRLPFSARPQGAPVRLLAARGRAGVDHAIS